MQNINEATPAISSDERTKFEQLITVFRKINAQINLSAIRDEQGIWEKHIVDSLLGLELLKSTADTPRLLDVGSGGGFPALPLAIVRPAWQITAMDSVGKKMRAVQWIATELELSNFTTLIGRCEELGREEAQREQYDLVTARALAPWATLLELTAPFVRIGGVLVLYLGPSADEFDPLLAEEFGLGVTAKRSHILPSGEGRQIWQLTKLTELDRRFPRANGVPKKEPIVR